MGVKKISGYASCLAAFEILTVLNAPPKVSILSTLPQEHTGYIAYTPCRTHWVYCLHSLQNTLGILLTLPAEHTGYIVYTPCRTHWV